MGDISTEPSMEEILSSIKRIIAEEGEGAVASRARRGRPASAVPAEPEAEPKEVLELSDPVVRPRPEPAARAEPSPVSAAPVAAAPEPILSDRIAEATRGPLEALSRMVVKPEVAGSDTLEGLVRELLKPMLRDWLDSNLPQIVESMVAREIARITRGS